MKLGGIHSVLELVNFLIDKVGKPYITSYVNHVSNHPNAWEASYAYDIMPDIEAFNTNLPTGC